MAYATSWHALPEVEVQPNNFRVAVAGREMGLNRIRWVHPMTLPQHTHPEHEQANVILTGRIEMTIGAETMELGPGDIAIVPRGTAHSGRSLAGDAVYLEVFSPLRIENLIGALGGPVLPPREEAS
jgi:mannose-6-phosphate isomerase-like protein (cupin superfamily)